MRGGDLGGCREGRWLEGMASALCDHETTIKPLDWNWPGVIVCGSPVMKFTRVDGRSGFGAGRMLVMAIHTICVYVHPRQLLVSIWHLDVDTLSQLN